MKNLILLIAFFHLLCSLSEPKTNGPLPIDKQIPINHIAQIQ